MGPSPGPAITTEISFFGSCRSTGLVSLMTRAPTSLSISLLENPGMPVPSLRARTAKLPSGRFSRAHSAIVLERSSCDVSEYTQYLADKLSTSSSKAARDNLGNVDSVSGMYRTLGCITSIGPVRALTSALNRVGCHPLPIRVRPCTRTPRWGPRRASSLNASTVTVDQHRRGESENGLQLA